ncbi:hypothetical protein LM602_06010 [Candidatus Acetothermia bacterium]|jgi:hypothetical protein|nr:hypothetical protein [Candidatus Acetothermia bacterium]MCI2432093.1 hypothetical protein [Candidatus Acetothermia bacterium]MCI2435900.1 hypothetical protein [Candidatus Acetothermia bacterium]
MRVEVDSSGVWGDLAKPTIFAFSNSTNFSLWIAPSIKKTCIEAVRKQKGWTDVNDYLRLYSISIFLLLRDHLKQISEIVLDLEYPKKMGLVRSTLVEFISKTDPQLARTPIRVRRIGKTSRAHYKANAVYRGEQPADRWVQAKEILDLF